MFGVARGCVLYRNFPLPWKFPSFFKQGNLTPEKLASLLNSQLNYWQYVDYKALFHLEYIIYYLFTTRFLMFKMQSNAYLAFFSLL